MKVQMVQIYVYTQNKFEAVVEMDRRGVGRKKKKPGK
jgi:hypothetical protein